MALGGYLILSSTIQLYTKRFARSTYKLGASTTIRSTWNIGALKPLLRRLSEALTIVIIIHDISLHYHHIWYYIYIGFDK